MRYSQINYWQILFNLSPTACIKHKAQPPQPHLKPKDHRKTNKKVMKSMDRPYSLLFVDNTVMAFFTSTNNLFQNAKSLTSSYEPSCWEICQCWSFWACPPSEKDNNTKLQNNKTFWRSWWLMYVTWLKYSFHSTLPRVEDFHRINIWVVIIFNQVNLKIWVTTAPIPHDQVLETSKVIR